MHVRIPKSLKRIIQIPGRCQENNWPCSNWNPINKRTEITSTKFCMKFNDLANVYFILFFFWGGGGSCGYQTKFMASCSLVPPVFIAEMCISTCNPKDPVGIQQTLLEIAIFPVLSHELLSDHMLWISIFEAHGLQSVWGRVAFAHKS